MARTSTSSPTGAERGKTQLQRLLAQWRAKPRHSPPEVQHQEYTRPPGGQRIALLATDPPTDEDERRERERDDADVYGERRSSRAAPLSISATRQIITVSGLEEQHAPRCALARLLTNWRSVTPADSPHSTTTPASAPGWSPAGGDLRRAWRRPAPRQLVDQPITRAFAPRQREPRRRLRHRHRYQPPPTAHPAAHRRPAGRSGAAPFGSSNLPLVTKAAVGLDTTLNRLDPASGQLSELLRERGDLAALTASADGTIVAALHNTPHDGFNIWAGAPNGPLTCLTDLRPELRAIPFGEQERPPGKPASARARRPAHPPARQDARRRPSRWSPRPRRPLRPLRRRPATQPAALRQRGWRPQVATPSSSPTRAAAWGMAIACRLRRRARRPGGLGRHRRRDRPPRRRGRRRPRPRLGIGGCSWAASHRLGHRPD
ncbi:MAG: hypothetical protein U0232_15140 [Thermomicrobiales bacterium]